MISTSIDYKKITSVAVKYVSKYRVLITVGLIIGALGFSFYRISTLSDPEPSQEKLLEKISEYSKVKIDEEVVQRIESLVDSNIEVNPEFGDRTNPFADN